jgi:uncharacterized protein (TIGR03437 family)
VCHKGTVRDLVRAITLVLALACLAAAQSPAPAAAQSPARTPAWRKIGTSAVELMLASPATGPVERVWFSPSGATLYARSASGKVFETSDYEVWQPSANTAEPVPQPTPPLARYPEPGAHVTGAGFGRVFALGRQLYRSTDGGTTWINLTAFKTDSVIGIGQRSVAVPPPGATVNLDQIVVSNQFGVWRSLDGGLSWAGLNELLPNLPVKRILSTPSGAAGTRVEVASMGTVELPPGSSVWQPVQDSTAAADAARLAFFSTRVAADVRSFAQAENTIYLGASDGRIFISRDAGASFTQTVTDRATGPVERIFVDPTRPDVALAALGGPNAPHVLRTTNAGGFWDELDSNLPNAPAHSVTGERASNAVYLATDRGVFYARADLDTAGSANVNWIPLSESLPPVPASDVRLDPSGIQLYAAIEGYGVYATAAPHRLANLRVVNAADFSTRAAAPGSLLSVVGARISSARAGNLDYPVLAAADDASQIQVPFDATGPSVTLALATGTGNVQFGMQVQPVSPAIFVARDGAPMLQDSDSGLLLDARKAAHAGARLLVFATGLGLVSPQWPTGVPAPADNPPAVAANVRAFLNGAPVAVTRATLAGGYIGFYVVELQLPALNNSGPAELYLTADGVESNRVQITIEQ